MLLLLALVASAIAAPSRIYDLEADDLRSGLPVPLSYYQGNVLLIVNVASACGYTDSTYSMLNALHQRYSARGLSILAFPCNQVCAQRGSFDPFSEESLGTALPLSSSNALPLRSQAHQLSHTRSP
jgi:hypothetical protein